MRWFWLIIALAGVLPFTGCGKGGGESASEGAALAPVAVQTAVAVERPMEVSVEALGTLSAGQGRSARIAPVTLGRVDTVYVREGDRVAAGQVLVTLDSRPARAQAKGATAAFAASNAQARAAETAARAAGMDQKSAVRQATLALDAARLDRKAGIQQAESNLRQAETDMKRTNAGPRAQEIAQSDQAVKQAKSIRDRAATEVDRVTFLHGKGVSPLRQLEDARTALDVAEAGLETAKQQAAMAHEGSRPEDVRGAELRLTAARQALSALEAGGDAKVRQAESALRQAREGALQVTVKRQEATAIKAAATQKHEELAAAQTAAGYTVLRSPISGIVTRRAVNPGDMADPASPAIEVANTGSLDLLAGLPAQEGIRVRPGMAAHVKAGDSTVNGRVISVGQVDPQTNLMPVRVTVDNARSALQVGAFATASIVLRTDSAAIVVPRQAVITRSGKNVVFTVSGDAAHQREVTVGSERDGAAEIVRGLKRGETVIRVGQYELADGARVKVAETKQP